MFKLKGYVVAISDALPSIISKEIQMILLATLQYFMDAEIRDAHSLYIHFYLSVYEATLL